MVALERDLLTDEVRSDPAALAALLHPDWTEIGRSGRRGCEEMFAVIAPLSEPVALDTPKGDRAHEQPASQTNDTSDDPPPHYHDNAAIAPDELNGSKRAPPGTAAAETTAIVAADCPMSEPPPPQAPARIRSGPPVTNYIPPEIIMKPIRNRAACFRGCYRAGLARNETLSGRMVVRFVIDIDGWVRKARVWESELADSDVVDCVRRAFVGLSYPKKREGGPVTIVYPLQFTP